MQKTKFALFGIFRQCEGVCVGVMQACARCNRPGIYKCSGCGTVCYCSAACQTEAWKRGHKGACGVLRAQQAGGVASQPASLSRSAEGRPLRQVPNVAPEKWLAKPERVSALVERDRESVAFSGCGVENLGNSCFVNSVLQVLTSTIPLLVSVMAFVLVHVFIFVSHLTRNFCSFGSSRASMR
jgi:hypothetical protein